MTTSSNTLRKKKSTSKANKSTAWKAACRAKMATLQELFALPVKKLRKFATKYEIQGRSKLKYKRNLVDALIGFVTAAEAGVKRPEEPPSKGASGSQENRQPQNTLRKKKTICLHKPATSAQGETREKPLYPKLERGSGRRFHGHVMGVDVHSEELAFCIIDEGKILKEGMVANTKRSRQELIELCRVFQVESVAMESTADYWRQLTWDLIDHEIDCLVTNATLTKNTQGKKTDKYDARRIAVAHRDGRLKPSVICSRAEFALRKDLRLAEKEVQTGTQYSNRIRTFQRMFEASKWVKDLHKSSYGRAILLDLPACATQSDLLEVIRREKGKWAEELLDVRTAELWEFHTALKDAALWDRYLREVDSYLHHRRQAESLYLTAVKYAADHPDYREGVEFLLTIPGVGFKSAAAIMAEILDINHFESPKALVRWAGLNPNVNQSGQKKNVTGHISKKGNKYLRKTLFVCAQNEYAQGHHPGHFLGAKMRAQKDQGKMAYKKAVVMGARKLLVWMWHMLTFKKQFRPNAPEDVLEKLQLSGQRKVRGFLRRIKAVTKHLEAGTKATLRAIRAYQEVDATLEFAKVVIEARKDEDEGHFFLPYDALVSLSQAFVRISEG